MKNYVHDTPLQHKAKPNAKLLCLALRKTRQDKTTAFRPFPYAAAATKQKTPKLIMKVAEGGRMHLFTANLPLLSVSLTTEWQHNVNL
jgi:hypothetical protein